MRPAPLQDLEVLEVRGEPVGGDRYVQQPAQVLGYHDLAPGCHGQHQGGVVAAHHPDVALLAVYGIVRLVYAEELFL